MGIASEMKKLTSDLASSHEDRTEAVGAIKIETKRVTGEARDLIKGFRTSRKELRAELKEASGAWRGVTSAKARKQRKEG